MLTKFDYANGESAGAKSPFDSIDLVGTTEVVPCYKTVGVGFVIRLTTAFPEEGHCGWATLKQLLNRVDDGAHCGL